MGCQLSVRVSPEFREFVRKHSPSVGRQRDGTTPPPRPRNGEAMMRGTGKRSRPRFDSHFSTEKVALVIGIDQYPQWAPLETAEGGAARVSALLAARGFEVKLLLGSTATRSNIVRALQRIDVCKTAIIYFAGHGISGRHGPALVPFDAQKNSHDVSDKVGQDYLHGWSARTKAHGVLFLFDCCYGGDFCVRMRGAGSLFSISQGEKSRIVISSSLKGEKVPDRAGAEQIDSPFTAALIASMEASCFSGSAIELFVSTRALAQQPKPTRSLPPSIVPKLGRLAGDEGGDVIL